MTDEPDPISPLEAKAEELLRTSSEPLEYERPLEPAGDVESRLRAIEQRADEMKRKREAEKSRKEDVQRSDAAHARSVGIGLSIAYVIIGLPLCGAALGWYLDQALHANAWKPILVMAGAIGGIAWTLVMLKRHEQGL